MEPIPQPKPLTQKNVAQNLREVFVNALWLLLTLTAIYLFAYFLGIGEIRERIATLGLWGPIVIILLKASTLVVAPLGGAPLYPIAGAAFGFWQGFLFTFLGDILGSAIVFYISRVWGRTVVRYFVTTPGMKLIDNILSYLGTTRGLIHARLIFFSFPEGVTYAAGLTTMPYWKFLVLMLPIGIGPAALLVAFGDIFSSYLDTHPLLVVSTYLFSLSLMTIGGYWFYRRAQKHAITDTLPE